MRTKKFFFALASAVLVVIISSVFASAQPFFTPQRGTGPSPKVIQAEGHDVSPALRDVPAIPLVAEPPAFREIPRQPLPRRGPKPGVLDPMIQASPGTQASPATLHNFEGLSDSAQSRVSGFTLWPPDTNGAVGPNHYVQWVNLAFAIYDKSGTKIYGPAKGNTLWQGFGGPCESSNDGDPIVLYDRLADRWFFSQFALPNYPSGPFYQCIAVSTGSDPGGSYNRYAFKISDTKMNDYPKFGVWPDGYYMAINQFSSSSWAGQGVAAFERDKMLAGDPSARGIYFDLYGTDPNLGGMLPSDFDGPAPPSGTPNYFVEMDDDSWGYSPDQLQIWAFSVDWTNLNNSTFVRQSALQTAPFDSNLCGYSSNCIPQPSGRFGTSRKLDALSDRLMYRLQYRHFTDHDSLVTNHTVDVDGFDHAGIRWYELRNTGGGWAIQQQGTYAPDADHRWMGSIAMDGSGNIALGFSVSGTSTYPSIRYTGRLVGDTVAEMTLGEASMIAGTGAQTGSSRWGDYSMMAVDPTDDSFWYTQEYYQTTSSAGWQTRIGSFSLAGVSPPPPSSPSLTVLSPNGGGTWKVNTKKTITWTSTGSIGSVNIYLSSDGGTSWNSIFSNTPNTGSQTWKVTGPTTTNARIKVENVADHTVYDISDGDFVIK